MTSPAKTWAENAGVREDRDVVGGLVLVDEVEAQRLVRLDRDRGLLEGQVGCDDRGPVAERHSEAGRRTLPSTGWPADAGEQAAIPVARMSGATAAMIRFTSGLLRGWAGGGGQAAAPAPTRREPRLKTRRATAIGPPTST